MPNNTIQSLARGCRILEIVAYAQNGIRLKDIASALGVGDSTAHNLVKTLSRNGYLECRSGRYLLGAALRELIDAGYRNTFMETAKESMLALSMEMPDLGLLYCEPRGMVLCVLLQCISNRPGNVMQPMNSTIHPYDSVSGLVYHAFFDPKHTADYRRLFPFSEQNCQLWSSFEEFENAVENTVKNGFAACEPNPDFYCVAAPVFLPDGECRGSLGASLLLGKLSETERIRWKDALIRRIQENARKLSQLHY